MFVGYSGQNILWVSQNKCSPTTKVSVIEVPDGTINETPENVLRNYAVWRNNLIKKTDLENLPPQNLRVAMVSQYGINCGIATYTKYLCDELRPLVADLRIMAEDADPKDCINDKQENVVRCWKRTGDYSRIIRAMEEYQPDLIYVQHEYGALNHGANWNTLIGHLNARWRTIVVLHSVYDHKDKLIFEAPCQEIIVHSMSGRDLLRKKGVDHATINYIPHGCMKLNPYQIRFSAIESKHMLFQYGFGFEYKGWENCLEIVEKLKKKYSDLVYVGIFNVSKFSEAFNNSYFDRLMTMARERGLENNFVLHKGFRSEEILQSYMAQCQVNLFPYWNHHEWRVHGASGAVRLALASGVPTIVGDVPFFSEFKGYIPVCGKIDEYVATITELFENQAYRESVQKKTIEFITERTWDKIAHWYLQCRPKTDFIALEKP